MIQDIAPHVYDSTYKNQPPADKDFIVMIYKNQVLLICHDDSGQFSIPILEETELHFPDIRSRLTYLFSIDGTAYYVADAESEEVPEIFMWKKTTFFRTMRPSYQAFAAITATQLWRWRDGRRFCGHCGTATKHSETERAYICPACGRIEYPKISPAVIVAITNGDKLLMSRYKDSPYRGYALIAGFVEIGETFEETVKREVMEEVGLKVKNIRYFKSQPWAFSDTEMIGFFADLDGDDTIVLQEDELSEAGWYHRDEIPDDDLSISVGSEMKMLFKYEKLSEVYP